MDNLYKYFTAQDASLPKAERLEQALLEMIQGEVLKSGEAIPPQRKIAEELTIALSSVTTVCNKLKKQGVLYGERGRGSFVAFKTQFAHDFGDRFLLDEFYLEEKDVTQVSETPILCNLVERLQFLNDHLPTEIRLSESSRKSKSLKEYGAAYLRKHGVFIHPEDVMLSHNAYISLWTSFQLCCPSGTVLGAPDLSFIPLFRNKLVANNVHLLPLGCDQYGVLPEALENACKTYGLNVLTCSPECELPTTNRMSRHRRMEIAQLARKYDITIIEHSWLLPTDEEPELPALVMFAPERTIFLEHGSKMLSCENFCSFSYIPQQMREKFVYLRNIIAGPLSLLSRKISQFWLENGFVERDFNKKNSEIIFRNELAREILDPLPVRIHKYARFCWMPLDKKQSGAILRERLLQRGVLISTAQNYLIGSICNEEGILIGHCYEPSRKRLKNALCLIKEILI